jgi:hypothetical protein
MLLHVALQAAHTLPMATSREPCAGLVLCARLICLLTQHLRSLIMGRQLLGEDARISSLRASYGPHLLCTSAARQSI